MQSFSELLHEYYKLQLEDTVHWPREACTDCIEFLQQIRVFQTQILDSHHKLTTLDSNRIKAGSPELNLYCESDLDSGHDQDELKVDPIEFLSPDFSYEGSESDTKSESTYISDAINPVRDENPPTCARKPRSKAATRNVSKRKPPIDESKLSIVRPNCESTPEERQLEALMLENRIFVCKHCDLNTKTFYGLREHVKTAHDFTNYSICCDKPIHMQGLTLYDHFRLHLDKDAFKCKECDARLLHTAALRQHMQCYHSTKPPTHVCAVCGKGFWSKNKHKLHIVMHGDKFPCQHCGKGTQRQKIIIT